MAKRETKAERAAWSKHFGLETKEPSKYANERKGKYASGYEAEVAANLSALENSGAISNLKEQVPYVLIKGAYVVLDGERVCIRDIKYVADFVWDTPDGKTHIGDAKGTKTAMYKMKKKMMRLLLGLDIEEL